MSRSSASKLEHHRSDEDDGFVEATPLHSDEDRQDYGANHTNGGQQQLGKQHKTAVSQKSFSHSDEEKILNNNHNHLSSQILGIKSHSEVTESNGFLIASLSQSSLEDKNRTGCIKPRKAKDADQVFAANSTQVIDYDLLYPEKYQEKHPSYREEQRPTREGVYLTIPSSPRTGLSYRSASPSTDEGIVTDVLLQDSVSYPTQNEEKMAQVTQVYRYVYL